MKTELSDGEWRLMKVLWSSGSMTIAQLTGALKEVTGWSRHTVISMLSRLETKGVLSEQWSGQGLLSRPAAGGCGAAGSQPLPE